MTNMTTIIRQLELDIVQGDFGYIDLKKYISS